jgi:hypothetical protein
VGLGAPGGEAVGVADAVPARQAGVWRPGLVGERAAVSWQNRMERLRPRGTPVAQDVCGTRGGHAVRSLGHGDRAGAIDGAEHRQLALFGAPFGHGDMNVPTRRRLERFLGCVTGRVRQTAEVRSLQAAV